jgi:hypothetical protein
VVKREYNPKQLCISVFVIVRYSKEDLAPYHYQQGIYWYLSVTSVITLLYFAIEQFFGAAKKYRGRSWAATALLWFTAVFVSLPERYCNEMNQELDYEMYVFANRFRASCLSMDLSKAFQIPGPPMPIWDGSGSSFLVHAVRTLLLVAWMAHELKLIPKSGSFSASIGARWFVP